RSRWYGPRPTLVSLGGSATHRARSRSWSVMVVRAYPPAPTVRRNRVSSSRWTTGHYRWGGPAPRPAPSAPLSSPAVGAAGLTGRPAGLEPRHRHPERRTGHIIQSDLVEEVHRLRVATVLTAHPDLQIRTGLPALGHRQLDHPADAFPVERLERRHPEDPPLQVLGEERALHVIPGEAPPHLGQVVGAEGEELGRLRDLTSGQRRPRYLDHGADQDPV